MKAKDVLGRRGEAVAADYLTNLGLRVIDRNWKCSSGEIDIVAIDRGTLVVVEVKTRSSLNYGHPFEAINAAKLARLYALASQWARAHDLRFAGFRVDAIAVLDTGEDAPRIEHLRAVS
ncbi:YraN family protein [Arthrobacter roseus]|uniref:YraN family protein n=1 Tax=Arthrobacter roseus TaxID=136274 RepID=UPI0019628944|nr:YraN family protein [Arthrobacter roseus]MBM7848844.1 putative endonuclease [Arthrobacter roseus]